MRQFVRETAHSRRSFFRTGSKILCFLFVSMAVAIKAIENMAYAKDKKKANKWVALNPRDIEKMQKRRKALAEMSFEKRDTLRRNFLRYEKLSDQEKEMIVNNQKEFQAMPKRQKAELLANERQFQGLQSEEKDAIAIKFKKWKTLTAEQQQRIEKAIQKQKT